jgi:hypothetical protein
MFPKRFDHYDILGLLDRDHCSTREPRALSDLLWNQDPTTLIYNSLSHEPLSHQAGWNNHQKTFRGNDGDQAGVDPGKPMAFRRLELPLQQRRNRLRAPCQFS